MRERDDIDEIIADTKRILGEDEPAGRRTARNSEQEYSDWLYNQGKPTEASAAVAAATDDRLQKPAKKKKKGRAWKIILWIFVALVAFCLAMWFIFARQPEAADGLGARKLGYSTILMAGTDKDGTRTDTMMLLSVDQVGRKLSLVSIPRDTRVPGGYSVPKINSAYGAGGCGKDGMEELMTRVTEIIGYRPDGYVLVDLDGFMNIVDAIGGVTVTVPMDMDYDDPSQDLSIHLKAGEQKLNGEQAMGLVRFRSGYAQADLQRVQVQRDFIKAAMNQCLTAKNLPRAPQLMTIVLANTTTDMSLANLTWLAKAAMVCDRGDIRTETLPGYPQTISGGSYYIVSAGDTAALLNECCNPYERDITAGDLSIRTD